MLMNFFSTAYYHREIIRALALRDFQSRFAGTLVGPLWAFAHPLAIIGVFYFVFSVGFKATAPEGVPFILWFSVGLMAWFYFSEALPSAANSIVTNSYLVKKTIFPVEILPIVQIVSSMLPHLIFLLLVIFVLLANNIHLESFRLLVFYYMLCTTFLLLGLGWLLAALEVFYRDISQVLKVIMNLLFWMTPIVWDPKMMPEKYEWLFLWNPMHYIVDGYRGVLIYAQPKWPDTHETIIFWCTAFAFLALGSKVFQHLKPEFADVL